MTARWERVGCPRACGRAWPRGIRWRSGLRQLALNSSEPFRSLKPRLRRSDKCPWTTRSRSSPRSQPSWRWSRPRWPGVRAVGPAGRPISWRSCSSRRCWCRWSVSPRASGPKSRCPRSPPLSPPLSRWPRTSTTRLSGHPGSPCRRSRCLRSRRRDDRRDIPTSADEGHDPGPTRIPVLDLDRLRSWLTLGDVNLGRLAIVSVELDNLGFVEERLGYAAGGHLLEAITQRLRTVTRPRDVVAHVNRERFVLVCRDVPDRQAAEGLAERIAMGVAHPSVVLAGVAEVTASIGVALAGHLDERPESVLRRAIKAGNDGQGARWSTRRDQRGARVDDVLRGRAQRRDRERRAAPPLPAHRQLRDRSGGGVRGAGAVGAPGARAPDARGVLPRGRGQRHDRAARALDGRARVPADGRVAAAGRCHPEAQPQPLGAASSPNPRSRRR